MKKQIEKAITFATKAHEGQTRKYTGEPYIVHPLAVMETVKTVEHTDEMLMAAVLHDTVEDCDVTLDQIAFHFGHPVADLVEELTDISKPEDGNRAVRKAMDREHSAQASSQGQTIKMADLLDNTKSITEHDKDFAQVYMKEKDQLVQLLVKADKTLLEKAQKKVDMWFNRVHNNGIIK